MVCFIWDDIFSLFFNCLFLIVFSSLLHRTEYVERATMASRCTQRRAYCSIVAKCVHRPMYVLLPLFMFLKKTNNENFILE